MFQIKLTDISDTYILSCTNCLQNKLFFRKVTKFHLDFVLYQQAILDQ
jgi:hypothetical protein